MNAPDPTATGAVTPATAAAAAEALWRRWIAAVDALAGQDWQRPTQLPGWDVHALISHVAGASSHFAGLDQPAPPPGWAPPAEASALDASMAAGVAARRDHSREELSDELRRAAAAQVSGLAALDDLTGDAMGPLGPTDQRDLFAVRMFDLWHHLWDLAAALGQHFDLADDSVAARECHAYVAARVPWLHAARTDAPDGASVRIDLGPPLSWDRSAVVEGGRGRWTDTPADDVVAGPAAAFSLTMTGRLDRDAATAAGLTATGAEAERLLGARMF